ncbi:hypothetical protein FACS189491_03700 [Spirochaetia bacterium]|nr:hypothetical protein FACS189491_03700 [Spirochaetia bacterium]
MLPTVDFFGTPVTRLIIGDNSMEGLSYIPKQYLSSEMMDYWTADKCVKALFEAEKSGYNAYMAVADPFLLRVIRQYRNEGGKMHIMFQTYPPIDLDVSKVTMKRLNPIAVYHQGTTADIWLEEGKVSFLRERINRLKDMGIPTGLATHVPEIVIRAEEENWGLDYYMTCLQNSRKYEKEESTFLTGKEKTIVFRLNDRWDMFKVIQQVQKPCIVFKIFAGGQMFYDKTEAEIPGLIEKSMQEVYANIKPEDIVLVGAFQKYKNQIRENAEICGRVLG